jgi:hypothetical protein
MMEWIGGDFDNWSVSLPPLIVDDHDDDDDDMKDRVD